MATKSHPRDLLPRTKPPSLIVHDFEQGTPEWYEARRGKTTASELSALVADSEDRLGRATLMRRLVGEIMTEEVRESYTNKDMEEGKEREPEIRAWYQRRKIVAVVQAGFIFNPEVGAGWSPDGLIGKDGAVEIKWHKPEIMVGILDKGAMPLEHRAQCHGGLLIGRRRWIDLVLYSHPKMPKAVFRIEADAAYHQTLRNEIEKFNWERDKLLQKLRSMMS